MHKEDSYDSLTDTYTIAGVKVARQAFECMGMPKNIGSAFRFVPRAEDGSVVVDIFIPSYTHRFGQITVGLDIDISAFEAKLDLIKKRVHEELAPALRKLDAVSNCTSDGGLGKATISHRE